MGRLCRFESGEEGCDRFAVIRIVFVGFVSLSLH